MGGKACLLLWLLVLLYSNEKLCLEKSGMLTSHLPRAFLFCVQSSLSEHGAALWNFQAVRLGDKKANSLCWFQLNMLSSICAY